MLQEPHHALARSSTRKQGCAGHFACPMAETMATKRVAVVLSGCGYLDGSEAQEATYSLLALDQAGAEVTCFAPDAEQCDVVDHQTGQPAEGQTRNIRTEAARLTRGNVGDVAAARAVDFDALVLPGGYGAAKNLCNYAFEGVAGKVHPEVERLIREFSDAGKPIGAICIAPVLVANVLGKSRKPTLTIGSDEATAKDVEALGAKHCDCPPGDACVDRENRIVTTPAYMYESRPADVYRGIQKLVTEVLSLAEAR